MVLEKYHRFQKAPNVCVNRISIKI